MNIPSDICETCKYRGLDFLDFLRSGEKDIDVFAASQQRRRKSTKRQTSEVSKNLGGLTASILRRLNCSGSRKNSQPWKHWN